MIYDSLVNLHRYIALAPDAMVRLRHELQNLNPDTPTGKNTLLVGKLFVLIQRYDTRNAELENLEVHEDFVDLQMVISGKETIYYCGSLDGAECVREMSDDYAFYRAGSEKVTGFELSDNRFAVFFPGEGHMGGFGENGSVVKVVVKIHKSLLQA